MKKKGNRLFIIALVLLATGVWGGVFLASSQRTARIFSAQHKLDVTIVSCQADRLYSTTCYGLSARAFRGIFRKIENKSITPEKLNIQGHLLIEDSGTYTFSISANRSARIHIGDKLIPGKSAVSRAGDSPSTVHLQRGVHNFKIEFLPANHGSVFRLFWKQEKMRDRQPVPGEVLFSPAACHTPVTRLIKLCAETRRGKRIKNAGYVLVVLSALLLMVAGMNRLRKKTPEFRLPENNGAARPTALQNAGVSGSRRLIEIDATKGVAGLLMIATHISGIGLLPFGTFGAAMFFFCSGMNTILFMDKIKARRFADFFQILFVLILFFGGFTQIKIAHPGISIFIPEFLQFSALSVLLIFLLSKMFNNPMKMGALFPLPFLLHLFFPHELIPQSGIGPYLGFMFGSGAFHLFPWSGYFLYGILLLRIRDKKWGLATAALTSGSAAIISIALLNIPINKFNMSVSYMCLSLFVVTVVFILFRIAILNRGTLMKVIKSTFALVGRNSLMFVYMHYFAVHYLKPGHSNLPAVVSLLIWTAIIYTVILLPLMIYDRIRNDYYLFLPSLSISLLLVFLRITHSFSGNMDLRLIDIITGVLFALLYVQLRGIIRKRLPHRPKASL